MSCPDHIKNVVVASAQVAAAWERYDEERRADEEGYSSPEMLEGTRAAWLAAVKRLGEAVADHVYRGGSRWAG